MRYLLFAIAVIIYSCTPAVEPRIPKPAPNTKTYVPIYIPRTEAQKVVYQPPKPIVNSGKIYVIGNYLLQVEVDSGIHIIDYANRTAPRKVGFIKSLFCSEMGIKGGFLYINNVDDLVVLNITDINNPVEVNRIPNAFPSLNKDYPPATNTFFECADPSKGVVIGWRVETRDYPQCYR
jgi:hypothetical protein